MNFPGEVVLTIDGVKQEVLQELCAKLLKVVKARDSRVEATALWQQIVEREEIPLLMMRIRLQIEKQLDPDSTFSRGLRRSIEGLKSIESFWRAPISCANKWAYYSEWANPKRLESYREFVRGVKEKQKEDAAIYERTNAAFERFDRLCPK